MRHAFLNEPMRPVAERGDRDAERGFLRLADAEMPRRRMLPRKEREDRAGLALLVAIIKMGSSKFTVFLTSLKPSTRVWKSRLRSARPEMAVT